MAPRDQLQSGLAALKLGVPAGAVDLLLRYCALLEKWNRVYNLTAIRERARLVSHHLLDSLAVAPYVEGPSMVDVGSGAGLPGIPLAVANPSLQVVLLESNHKKGAFLNQAVAELGLKNVQVAISRAEDWRPLVQCDVAISRAFADLAGFVEAAARLLKPGGILLAMKGLFPHEELTQLPAAVSVESVVELEVPGRRAARHLVRLRLSEQP
jgi:16S rRNA (guanine527-N7)-methyltransferase